MCYWAGEIGSVWVPRSLRSRGGPARYPIHALSCSRKSSCCPLVVGDKGGSDVCEAGACLALLAHVGSTTGACTAKMPANKRSLSGPDCPPSPHHNRVLTVDNICEAPHSHYIQTSKIHGTRIVTIHTNVVICSSFSCEQATCRSKLCKPQAQTPYLPSGVYSSGV